MEGIGRQEGENLERIPFPYSYRPLHGLIPFLAARAILRIRRRMKRENPDVVVVVQGSIEIASAGLISSRLAGLRTVSYLPLAQTRKEMGSRLALLRDLVNRLYYRLPCKFVTISQGQAELLAARGVPPARIAVVHNFIEKSRFPKIEKSLAREKLGLEQEPFLFGTPGRLVFGQKGQDILIRAVRRLGDRAGRAAFLIVGDGPDRDPASRMIREFGLEGKIRLLPWQSDPAILYSALDAVILPSRYEGVPLVMIEAAQYRLPVIASRIPGITEFLPEGWLFLPGDEAMLADRLVEILEQDQALRVESVAADFRRKFSRENSCPEFLKEVGR